MAPEVAGRLVDLRAADNQFVHKGELLLVIDPTNYEIALSRELNAILGCTELMLDGAYPSVSSSAVLLVCSFLHPRTFELVRCQAQAAVDFCKIFFKAAAQDHRYRAVLAENFANGVGKSLATGRVTTAPNISCCHLPLRPQFREAVRVPSF
jgi:multidrug resistance efflux pump